MKKSAAMDDIYQESGGAEKPPHKEIKVTELEHYDDPTLLMEGEKPNNLTHKVNHLDERVTKVEKKVELKHADSFQDPKSPSTKPPETNILDFM